MTQRRLIFAFSLAAAVAWPQQQPTELQKAVDEFRVQTRNLGLRADSPARARNGGKRPQWHGRIFENFRNDVLDAVPHEVVQRGGEKNILRRNQFGVNISGPVVIPKLYNGQRTTFFSFTYEGVRENVGRSLLRTIPTMQERTGDWGHVVDAAGQPLPIYDPATTGVNPGFNPDLSVSGDNLEYPRTPFPQNRIPASRLDAVAQAALRYYPAPNADAGPFFRNNYFIFSPERNGADGIIARVDHNLRERHRFGFGLNFSNGLDGAAPYFTTLANPGPVSRDRRSRRGSIEHVFTQSAHAVNTLTFEAATTQSQNKPEVDEQGNPFPYYSVEPYLPMGRSYPLSKNARNNFIVSDGYTTRWKEHRLRFVGQYIREQVNTFWPQYPEGSFRFGTGITSLPGIVNTGHAFASFLLGSAEFAERSVVASPSYFRKSRWYWAVRDTLELSRGLTFSAGIDLDVNTPRVERYDRHSTIDLERINPANGRPGALAVAGRDGYGRAFQPVTVAPQVSLGLSWNVLGNSKQVARLSYGRSYSPIPMYTGQWGTQAFNPSPARVSLNPQLIPAVSLSSGWADETVVPELSPAAANNTIADLVEPQGKLPTYQSASLSLERQLPGSMVVTLGLGYSGGKNLLLGNSGSNPNAIHLDALEYRDQLNAEAFKRNLRPFPQYQKFDVYSSWPEGKYRRDAGYVRLEKRTSGGLSLAASYEFSKQMDNYSGPYGVQDYYNRANEWSLTTGNTPHRLSLTYMYELPFGPNKPFLSASDWRRYLADGWSVSGVTTVAGGEPVSLRPQFNNTGGVVDALHVNVVPGVEQSVPDPGPELWFNTAAFSHPADFAIGNVARTHPWLRQPGNQNHDLSVTKRLALSAEQSIELSAVGLNFLNQGMWADPDMIIGTASAPNVNAGKIISSRGGRVIQLGLRYSF